jgi:hypothetical protein
MNPLSSSALPSSAGAGSASGGTSGNTSPATTDGNMLASGGGSIPTTSHATGVGGGGSGGSSSASDNPGLVTGLFPDRESAETAFASAHERGYTKDDLNLVMSDDTRKRHFKDESGVQTELGNKAAEGAGIGAGIGGTIGAIAAAVAAMGSVLVLPGLGLVVAGPLAAAAAGAGAAGGGLLGALIGWRIPEERVKHYEQGIKNGGILMGLKARNPEDAQHLEQSWKQSRGEHVYR